MTFMITDFMLASHANSEPLMFLGQIHVGVMYAIFEIVEPEFRSFG
jgi:hypothetical protein